MKILESGEMYLETILRLSNEKPYVISLDGNGHIKLLKKGKELASKIYERHVVVTEALISIGVEEKQAEEDACKIEHCLSDESFIKIKEHLEKHKV